MTHSGAGEGLIGWLITVVIVAIYVAFLVRALTRPDRTAASRVAWVAAILLLPVLGPLAYLFLGETSIGRDRIVRLKAAENHLIQPHARASEPPAERVDMSPEETDLFNMLASVNGFAMTTGNTVDLQADSDAAVTSLVADIDAATTTVHLSFYIWLDDHNGRLVADAVTRAASRGVTCRILVDALGSRALLKTETWKRMAHAGAHLAVALRDIPRFGNIAIRRVDLRNHRKIVVIDDAVAYCGSQNCADPAFLPKAKYAPWVDVFFRCTGPIVAQQQWLFLTTWVAETGERFAADAVNDIPNAAGPVRGAMFGTGPSTRAGDMSDVFITVIQAARRTLTISTPYFVPDQPLLQALCAAPRRGVKTTLVLPAHNDSWLVAQAARSSYVALLEAGVEIYEYPLGLLHSKTMTIDDAFALVGSSNMDRRSLELNYENNMLVSDPAVTADVLARQQTYIDASAPIALGTAQQWSLGKRLVQNSVAMLSPIL